MIEEEEEGKTNKKSDEKKNLLPFWFSKSLLGTSVPPGVESGLFSSPESLNNRAEKLLLQNWY